MFYLIIMIIVVIVFRQLFPCKLSCRAWVSMTHVYQRWHVEKVALLWNRCHHPLFSVLPQQPAYLDSLSQSGGTWAIPLPCPQSALTHTSLPFPLYQSLILEFPYGFFFIDLSCLIFSNHIMTTSLVIVKVIVGSTHREIPLVLGPFQLTLCAHHSISIPQ